MRGTPELLIILIVYFGGSVTLTRLAKSTGMSVGFVEIPALAAGVFALSLVFGGYAAEVLRAAPSSPFRKGRSKRRKPSASRGGTPSRRYVCRRSGASPCPASATTGFR